jgi:hypothetical protein
MHNCPEFRYGGSTCLLFVQKNVPVSEQFPNTGERQESRACGSSAQIKAEFHGTCQISPSLGAGVNAPAVSISVRGEAA